MKNTYKKCKKIKFLENFSLNTHKHIKRGIFVLIKTMCKIDFLPINKINKYFALTTFSIFDIYFIMEVN